MVELGLLKRVKVRDVWPHEAIHFSKWLADRLEDLGAALGLSLEFVGREVPVGRFSVDLLARDVDRDRAVVIENQLLPTNHDHLGKLITYAAGLDAGVVVWISTEFCEEHRSAIDWLNNHTESSIEFFAVTLEALQIDESRPAVNFKVLASPNGWQKVVAGGAGRARERGNNPFFFNFYERVLQDMRARGVISRFGISSRNYQIIDSVHKNIQFAVAFSRTRMIAQCTIDTPDAAFNELVFNRLREQADSIDAELSAHVEWDLVPGRNRQTLTLTSAEFNRSDTAGLDYAREWAVDHLARLRNAILPRLDVIVPELQREVLSASVPANGSAEATT